MSIAVASVGTLSTSTGTTAHSPNSPSGVSVGDLLVLVGTMEFAGGVDTPTNWTLAQSVNTFGGATGTMQFYRIADGTADDAPTITFSTSQNRNWVMLRVTGHDATTPLDTSGTTGGNSSSSVSSISTPALTIDDADSLIIAHVVTRIETITATWPGGWTEHVDTGSGSPHSTTIASRIVPAGSYSAETINLSAADIRVCLAACVYRPAAVAGGGSSGTAALTAGAATLSASATHLARTYDADGTLTAGAATLSASAAHAAKTYDSDAALTAGAATLSASASHDGPGNDADATLTAGAATLSASGTFLVRTYSAIATLVAAAVTLSASGDVTDPAVTVVAPGQRTFAPDSRRRTGLRNTTSRYRTLR